MQRVGASNAVKVFAWPDLTHRQKVALLFMAVISLDADMPPRYWGGWEMLARAIGIDVGDGSDPRVMANAAEQVRRVIASLVTAGAVVSSSQARTNVRAEYALALDPEFTYRPVGSGRQITWVRVPRTLCTTQKVGQESTEKVGQLPPKRCPSPHRKGGTSPTKKVPPRRTQEQLEEKGQEKSVEILPTLPKESMEITDSDDFPAPDPLKVLTAQEEQNRQSALLLQRQAEYERNLKESA